MGEWTRVIVNIGDWRAKQEDYLKGLANQGFKSPQDYCSRLDLGDETNSTAAA